MIDGLNQMSACVCFKQCWLKSPPIDFFFFDYVLRHSMYSLSLYGSTAQYCNGKVSEVLLSLGC